MKEEKKNTGILVTKNRKIEQIEEALIGAFVLESCPYTEDSYIRTYYTRSNIVEPRAYLAGTICAKQDSWTERKYCPSAYHN